MFLLRFYYYHYLFVKASISIFIVGLFFDDISFSYLRLVCIIDLFAFRLFTRIQLRFILCFYLRISFHSIAYTFITHGLKIMN